MLRHLYFLYPAMVDRETIEAAAWRTQRHTRLHAKGNTMVLEERERVCERARVCVCGGGGGSTCLDIVFVACDKTPLSTRPHLIRFS